MKIKIINKVDLIHQILTNLNSSKAANSLNSQLSHSRAEELLLWLSVVPSGAIIQIKESFNQGHNKMHRIKIFKQTNICKFNSTKALILFLLAVTAICLNLSTKNLLSTDKLLRKISS